MSLSNVDIFIKPDETPAKESKRRMKLQTYYNEAHMEWGFSCRAD
jgi:hypothetical protein